MCAAHHSTQQGIIRRHANSQCQERSCQSKWASSHLPMGECGISKMYPTVEKKKMLVRRPLQSFFFIPSLPFHYQDIHAKLEVRASGREREKGWLEKIERQKERSARTAGKPTDEFVLCANREPLLNGT